MKLNESIIKNLNEAELNHPTKFDKRIIKLAKNAAKTLGIKNVDYSFEYSYDVEDDVMLVTFDGNETFYFFDDSCIDTFESEIDVSNKSDAQIEKIIIKAVLNNK